MMKEDFKIFLYAITMFAIFGLAKFSEAASVTVCDSGCNYATISAALLAVGNGAHTVTVQNPYSAAENLTVNKSGQDPNNPLVIQGQADDRSIVKRLYLTGNNIVVRNLSFAGYNITYSACLQVSSGKKNITIDSNVFNCSLNRVSAIQLNRGIPLNENVTITNNQIYNIGYITAIGGVNVLFENNLIDGNLSSSGFTPDALWTWGHDVTFRNNEIKNISDDGVNHVDLIQASGAAIPGAGAYNIFIENNFWHDAHSQLCNLDTSGQFDYRGWEWRNNVFKNIRYRCNVGIADVKFYNNVFDNVDWEPIHSNGGVISGTDNPNAVSGTPAPRTVCNNLDIRNNLSIGRQLFLPATGTGYVNPNCVGAIVDNNFITSSEFGTVARQYQSHGINGGNPMIVNQAIGNYALLASSPAIDAGATLGGFSVDKIGVTRPKGGAWDIGAYEYFSNVDNIAPLAPSGLSVQ